MAKLVKLTALTREGTGRTNSKRLRRENFVPAVIYGAHQASEKLQVPRKEIEKVLKHATNEHMLVELEISDANGGKQTKSALIQAVQHDVITTHVLHLDLLAVSMTETITSEVPLQSIGEPAGVKTHGGLLEALLRHLEIECLPKDLPDVIEVDVSHLGVGDSIHVRDIKLPSGVTAVTDANLTVFLVAEPTVAEPEPAAAAVAQPEVIKEKKDPAADAKK